MDKYEVYPIGIVKSPYKNPGDAPRQGALKPDEEMEIEIYEKFREGLGTFEGTTHLIVLLWFDKADREIMSGTPPGAKKSKPVFTIRSPHRPNPVGFDIARIISVKDGIIKVSGLDALNNTPVIDIKPYVPSIDCIREAKGLNIK
ncbi:tRNA (N6-threonylcarbamoyladenosine(37)-N6)-methyltransferase TrmO [Methanoplanus endosymbiosus]|uniref:tRNA (N6-threonylcarbamoyladenosine(37)-N6)-methyltransferase TrmO n=1 Tax=Methanoplanus endosymbiosus TaxID=33865 RepID=A0A9E7PK08_9EURY|nr:tRNA (N6-threonylcarbamoyladenosine(37)-N6)-methyltransferase TrmO [Methanoplanus endosymbiosus]UUX91323.1 tRNA (N6-threonylcarbamoyladenosine(37)-N6)-methyltransferase TrmO [Methanoplanus endosymbiosus]